jgi:hypothetical protein
MIDKNTTGQKGIGLEYLPQRPSRIHPRMVCPIIIRIIIIIMAPMIRIILGTKILKGRRIQYEQNGIGVIVIPLPQGPHLLLLLIIHHHGIIHISI